MFAHTPPYIRDTIALMGDPPIEIFESLAERRIREAAERGEFVDLPGAGQPLRGQGGTYDPDWWVKEWIRRTSLEETLAEVRSTIRAELPKLKAFTDSPETSGRIRELNETISSLNRNLPAHLRLDPIKI
jgi:hypothetical protein